MTTNRNQKTSLKANRLDFSWTGYESRLWLEDKGEWSSWLWTPLTTAFCLARLNRTNCGLRFEIRRAPQGAKHEH